MLRINLLTCLGLSVVQSHNERQMSGKYLQNNGFQQQRKGSNYDFPFFWYRMSLEMTDAT